MEQNQALQVVSLSLSLPWMVSQGGSGQAGGAGSLCAGTAHLDQGVHQRVQQGDDVVPEVPSLCLQEQRAGKVTQVLAGAAPGPPGGARFCLWARGFSLA